MPQRLLFLDFDGVLHPGLAGTFIYLPTLSEFLRESPEIDVVLTTSWREEHPFSDLRSFFPPDIQRRVLGATPVLERAAGPTRFAEVQAWLDASQHTCTPWAALDDDASHYPDPCPQLVLCETHKGLRAPQLEAIRARLG